MAYFLAEGNPYFNLLLPVGILIAITLLLMGSRRRQYKRAQAHSTRLQDKETTRHARERADQILVTLAETSRKISAQSETRLRMLNELIIQADQRIEALQNLTDTQSRIDGTDL